MENRALNAGPASDKLILRPMASNSPLTQAAQKNEAACEGTHASQECRVYFRGAGLFWRCPNFDERADILGVGRPTSGNDISQHDPAEIREMPPVCGQNNPS